MDSCVVEKLFLLDPSSSRLDHDSLAVGHSLKKGRIECCCSSFTVPGESMSLPKKQCWCRRFEIVESIIGSSRLGRCISVELPSIWESFFCLAMGLEETWEGNTQVPSVLVPIPKLLTVAEASEDKLCSSASGAIPWRYLWWSLMKLDVTTHFCEPNTNWQHIRHLTF